MSLKGERDAARFLGVNVKTLRNWRWRGIGPVFVKFDSGGIRYSDEELIAYAARNSFRSTSEAQAARWPVK